MSVLFECAVGPVQDFIATARRSRDLWYGSWMLSELSKAAARVIVDNGGALIFPATTDLTELAPGSEFNAPNKIVAVFVESPGDVAEKVENAIKGRLYELRDDAFESIQNHPLFDRALAHTQVDDLVEYYWVSVPFREAGYAGAREMAEATLSARKMTRDFRPVNGDYRPKSSLDGVRESVIHEDAYPTVADSEAQKAKKCAVLFDRFRARPAERLSGVDILKRRGERHSNAAAFHSTSHMAALPFLKHVDENEYAGGRSSLIKEIRDLLANYQVTQDEDEGAAVFSSRLAEWIPAEGNRKDIERQMESILERYAGSVRPQPYYALLVADGDNMGATIQRLTEEPEPQKMHSKLSLVLSGFALKVRRIVEKEHEGVLVYSGGDDIMAYLPLHTALSCAHALAEQFAAEMVQFKSDNGSSPTLSTGIAVVHHLEPLSDALDLARQAEKAAKTIPGKHGLAVTVSKRSGTDRTIKDKREELDSRLEKMIEWRRNGAIAAGVAYELQQLDRVLGQSGLPEDALVNEALRIIDRKHESGGDSKIEGNVRDAIENWIKPTLSHPHTITLQELALELIVASMFASAIDMAEGKLKEESQ